MTQGGWIKLSRKMLDWEWYQDGNTMRLFVHLLLKANIEETRYQGVTIHRGELVTTAGRLAEELALSIKQIRRGIGVLKGAGTVAIKKHSKFVVISIKNYALYQDRGQAEGYSEGYSEGSQRDSQRDSQRASLLYYKNLRIKEGEKAAAAATPEYLPREEQWVIGYDPNNDDDDDDQ